MHILDLTIKDGMGLLFCNPDRPWPETLAQYITITDPATHHKIKPGPPKARSFYKPLSSFNPNVKSKT